MPRLLMAAVVALALAGCAAPPTPAPAGASPVVEVATAVPVGLSVPSIGVDTGVEPYALNPDGSMAVPPVNEPWRVSWFSLGVTPGDPGPAVLAGHVSGPVNGQSAPGVFSRLRELAPGDEVWIDRADGSRARFAVDRVEQHDKDTFPTGEVYGDTPGAELRLITCGGALATAGDGSRSYDSNVIAFAHLVAVVPG